MRILIGTNIFLFLLVVILAAIGGAASSKVVAAMREKEALETSFKERGSEANDLIRELLTYKGPLFDIDGGIQRLIEVYNT